MPVTTADPARVDALADELREQVIGWRRHLHAHPELSFQERETSAWIEARLTELGGLEISRPTETSVMARLVGGRSGPTVALRADMDALPVTEETDVPFASTRPGVMHACGHDGHTSMLLGAARILTEQRDAIDGEVRFLFQHGEEQLPGGAQQMVEAGVMDGVDRVMGLHLWARTPVGTVSLRAGPLMAACDVFRIEVLGRGGHVSAPHLAVDPIAIGAEIVSGLNHIVARNTDPLEAAVVGVTEFHAGDTPGVIPHSAVISGGTNVFDPEIQEMLERRIGEIAEGICAAHGARCEVEYTRAYRAVVNDEALAGVVEQVARGVVGDGGLHAIAPVLAGEDFSAYIQRAPGVFAFVGARDPARPFYDHHHPRFYIDERALDNGTRMYAHGALALLAHGRP